MKKLIAIIVTVILICSLSVAIVSCKKDEVHPLVGGVFESKTEYKRYTNTGLDMPPMYHIYHIVYEFYEDGTGIRYTSDDLSNTKKFRWGKTQGSGYELYVISEYYIHYGGYSFEGIDSLRIDPKNKVTYNHDYITINNEEFLRDWRRSKEYFGKD